MISSSVKLNQKDNEMIKSIGVKVVSSRVKLFKSKFYGSVFLYQNFSCERGNTVEAIAIGLYSKKAFW